MELQIRIVKFCAKSIEFGPGVYATFRTIINPPPGALHSTPLAGLNAVSLLRSPSGWNSAIPKPNSSIPGVEFSHQGIICPELIRDPRFFFVSRRAHMPRLGRADGCRELASPRHTSHPRRGNSRGWEVLPVLPHAPVHKSPHGGMPRKVQFPLRGHSREFLGFRFSTG